MIYQNQTACGGFTPSYHCDQCGNEMKVSETNFITIESQLYPDKDIEICDTCLESLFPFSQDID